jgi:hypothetical protein
VRGFLRIPGEVDSYPAISVDWKRGALPTLFVYEGETLLEELDLRELTLEQIHDELSARGFTRIIDEEATNDDEKPVPVNEL